MTAPLLQSFLDALAARPDWSAEDNRDAELLFYALASAAHGELGDYEQETLANLYDIRSGYGCWLSDIAAAVDAMALPNIERPEAFRAGMQAALQMARVFLLEINLDAKRRRPEVDERGYFTGWAIPTEGD